MEFDEMKKIWDAQNNKPLYVLDEKALHNRIQSKMSTIRHFTSVSEWLLILINLGAGAVLIERNPTKQGANIFLYLEAAWMFGIVVYIVVHHFRRVKAGRQFDRSIQGDLDHAISIASYQMRLSQIIRWNFLPMGVIMIFSGWEAGKLLKVSLVILISYSLAFYVTSKGTPGGEKKKTFATGIKGKTGKSVFMSNILRKSTCLFPIIFSWLFACAQGIAGVWNGTLHVQSNELPIVFHIGRDSTGKLIASFDSPGQKAFGLPVSEVITKDDSVMGRDQ